MASPDSATETKSRGKKKDTSASRQTLDLPLNCLQDLDKLDHPHVRAACETDIRSTNRCFMCERPYYGFFGCKVCGATQYCSWECEVDDAAQHALVCETWRATARPPSKAARRIIIFPARSTAPIFAWSRLTHSPQEPCPRISLTHPELWPFYTHAIPSATPTDQLARLGCINTSRALAARKTRIGHGLFLIEWIYPAADADPRISMDWINRSILSTTTLAPGQSWFWTGPVALVAFDLARTRPRAKKFRLDHVTLRDMRHAMEFFALNMRNACVPTPGVAGSVAARFPFPVVPGVKMNEVQGRVAQMLGVTEALEEVHVSREVPPATREFQGVLAVGAALGLAWVVRVVLNHGVELDWLYEGLYDARESGKDDGGAAPRGGDANEEGSTIPALFDLVFMKDEATGALQVRKLPRSGDGLLFLHAGGGKLWKQHVQALVKYLEEEQVENLEQLEIGPKGFKRFWRRFKAKENIPDDVPSPYELTPTLTDLAVGDRFLICREVIKPLREATLRAAEQGEQLNWIY